MKKHLLEKLDALWNNLGGDLGFWLAVASMIGAGPAYLRVVLQARNKRLHILGDLHRKSRKLDNELEQKLAAKKAREAKRAEKEKK